MRKVLLFLLLFLVSNTSDANVNPITSKGSLHVVTSRTGGATVNRLTPIVESPDVVYNSIQNSITIDFGVQPINVFTVTIISVYTEVDYSVTSSFAPIPLSVDGVSDYTIVIETDSGDVFEGTLSACDYSF